MNLTAVARQLQAGEVVTFRAFGNSMRPLILSGDTVTVRPLPDDEELEEGQIVLAKVRGRYYLHHAAAFRSDSVRIENHRGRPNGWTARRNVIGALVE